MIRPNLVAYAEAFSWAVVHELEQATLRAKSGLFTEAVMRLGRATEASLYAVAKDRGLSVLNQKVQELAIIREQVRACEVELMRSPGIISVKKLAGLSKRIAEAIALLAHEESECLAREEEMARPNEQLLRDIKSSLSDGDSKRRVASIEPLLRSIQDVRNAGAHASLSGEKREIDQEGYEETCEKVNDFLSELFEIALGERARESYTRSDVSISVQRQCSDGA